MEEKNDSLYAMRHSLAHILAQSVLQLYPDAKFAIGPVIEDGFYYDFDLGEKSFKTEDLAELEKRMKKIISQDQKFEMYEAGIDESIEYIRSKHQPYKLELAQELKEQGEKRVRFYRNILKESNKKTFIDLCKGPHVTSTRKVGAFKLTKIAGAYWRGSEKNKMLQRIYGVAFQTQNELNIYLDTIKQAELRDHRRLGQELELFMISEEVGQGLPLWLPKGAMVRQIIEEYITRQYLKNGYILVKTPHIGSEKLFNISGHLDYYKESMYGSMKIDDEKYYLKPMNCPMHLMIYRNSMKSYRDLPIRYAELGTVYRYERSGVLHGLTRVRGFTQDDGHILCTPQQLEEEVSRAIMLIKEILEKFGFKQFRVALSVRDPKNLKNYLGKDASWKHAENALKKSIEKLHWKYTREEGEAVFYGPKLDVKVTDAIGREWQISTLQVDFNLPKRFGIYYIDKDSGKKEPFMLHRALLGSIERFTGILIEHYAGAFPAWLSPLQVHIIPVSKDYHKHALKLSEELKEQNIRIWFDDLNETVSYKVRKGERLKIPYILVIGEKEVSGKKLCVRKRGKKDVEKMLKKKFIEKIKAEMREDG